MAACAARHNIGGEMSVMERVDGLFQPAGNYGNSGMEGAVKGGGSPDKMPVRPVEINTTPHPR